MTPYLIVLLAYVIGGQGNPVDEPLRFTSKGSFASLELCQAEIKSDDFQMRRAVFAAQLEQLARANQEATMDVDDNETAVTVATTVSCEEDKRL